MICKYCDKNIPDDSLFCPYCGEYLNIKQLEGRYCALSGRKISHDDYRVVKRFVITHQESESRGWYNQITITRTRGYEEYFSIDQRAYKKFELSWRNLVPLSITILLGITSLLALLVYLHVWEFNDVVESGIMPLYQLILCLVILVGVWIFIFTIVFALLSVPFYPKLKEIGHATRDDAEEYVLKNHPKIRKKHETLISHGCYEDANKLIDKYLKIF